MLGYIEVYLKMSPSRKDIKDYVIVLLTIHLINYTSPPLVKCTVMIIKFTSNNQSECLGIGLKPRLK